jgi:5-methylcytosine-specific restriction protein A
MNDDTAKFAVHQVADRIGLAITARHKTSADGPAFEFLPVDFHPNDSFAVQFNLRWRSAEAVLVPGQFSAALIQQMGQSSIEGKQVFSSLAKALESKRIKVQMRVNGSEMNPADTTGWPSAWNRLELTLRTQPMVIEAADTAIHERLILELVVPFFGMMAALIGVEENEPVTSGEVEGRVIQTIATKYERKRLNREACIQLKGTRCLVCGFDFAVAYGPLGIGYIEVHHTKPVASMGGEYRLNIETDLVPLCANCHAMAHREEPPVTVERLKSLVEDCRKAASTIK